MGIGSNVKRFRELNNLTQAELARRVNVSQVMINRIEHNTKMPSLVLIIDIANVLNCTLDDLVN